jgi:choline kinase
VACSALTDFGGALPGAGALVYVLTSALAVARPLKGALDWLVPPLFRAAEYGTVLALAGNAGVNGALPAAFGLVAAVAYHHYDTVYRIRGNAGAPPAWLVRAIGGQEGRTLLLTVLAAVLTAAQFKAALTVLAVVIALVVLVESVRFWVSAGAPAVHDEGETAMIGLVLAAGAGRRLRPYTDTLPKALVPVGPEGVEGEPTVLDLTLGNFAEIGLTEVAVIVGYRKEAVYARKAALEAKYGLRLTLIDNDKAEEWNNAYSLWCGRDALRDGVILANGDTVHPVSVEKTLLAARGDGKRIVLAVDTVKKLADEEMKVVVDPAKGMTRITKLMDPAEATGEYIGVTLIEGDAAPELADALKTVWESDPQQFYEHGYQELVNRGFRIDVAPIGEVDWVEIDNHDDLARGREIACRY